MWTREDEALQREMASQEAVIEEALETVWQQWEWCEGCQHRSVIHDPYGTGDSPDVAECTLSDWRDCPRLRDALERVLNR